MRLWPGAPRAFVGTSPWIGAGQFGPRALEFRAQLYDRPEAMLAILRRAAELGWGLQSFVLPGLVSALEAFRAEGGAIDVVLAAGMFDLDAELDGCASLEPRAVCLHAAVADRLSGSKLDRQLERVEETGAIPGIATHHPARTVPLVQETRCRIVMAPANPANVFMGRDPQAGLRAIQETSLPVIAKKTLAAGRVSPREGLAHAVSLGVAAVAVGVTSVAELEEDHAILEELGFLA
jgi:hypothetical protein